nr:hypothetical protein CR513_08514 [Ipomoea batatas]GMD01836.1 hypothetical protein CR513_08514 [Ipomoea batatas]
MLVGWANQSSPESPSSRHRSSSLPLCFLRTTTMRSETEKTPRVIHVDRSVLRNTREFVEHNTSAFDESQEDASECGGSRRRAEALAQGEDAARGGSGDDGVPRILLLADVDHGAVEDGEEAAPDGEAAADPRRVHPDGLGGADHPGAVGGVVEAFNKVEGGAAHGSHAERAADVV